MRLKLHHRFKILLFSAILWLSLTSQVLATSRITQPQKRHILERLSFGVTSSQIKQVDRQGIETYIQSQLSPETIAESPILNNYLAELSSIHQEPIELQKTDNIFRENIRNAQGFPKLQKKIRQKVRNFNNEVREEAIDAHLYRAIYSNRQLQEVMVDLRESLRKLNQSINLFLEVRVS